MSHNIDNNSTPNIDIMPLGHKKHSKEEITSSINNILNNGNSVHKSIEEYIKYRTYHPDTLESTELKYFKCENLVDGFSAYYDTKPYVFKCNSTNATKPEYANITSTSINSIEVFCYADMLSKYMNELTTTNSSMSYIDLTYFLALANADDITRHSDIINRSFDHLRNEAKNKSMFFANDREIVEEYDYRINRLNELNTCYDTMLEQAKEYTDPTM